MEKRFHPTWEPTLLEKRRLARGTWWYEDKSPWQVEMVRVTYDYTSDDLEEIEKILLPI